MFSPRKSRYKEGRVDALRRVTEFCARRLARMVPEARAKSDFREVIAYCTGAKDRLDSGKQWSDTAPALYPGKRSIS